MKKRDIVLEFNQAMTTPAIFIEAYNKTIPTHYPKASIGILKQFQQAHPALFKRADAWSIEKHRKRLMDWLSSRQEA